MIGRYEAADASKSVAYLEEDTSGFPPRQNCSVFLVDNTADNPPLSAEEALRREPPPHHLLAHGSYPTSQARHWIVELLVMPSAIWCLFAVATGLKRRRAAAIKKLPASAE
jgi:hypothetical protein